MKFRQLRGEGGSVCMDVRWRGVPLDLLIFFDKVSVILGIAALPCKDYTHKSCCGRMVQYSNVFSLSHCDNV